MRGGAARPLALVGIAALATLALAGTAHASATLTYPADGATVALGRNFDFTFRWTLPPTEDTPQVEYHLIGNSSEDAGCQPQDPHATSCLRGFPWVAGTYTVFVQTFPSDPNSPVDHYDSPTTRFVVPAVLGWANRNPWGANPSLETLYSPHTTYSLSGQRIPPRSLVDIAGFVNSPGARVVVTYTVTHGRRVVLRHRDVRRAGGDEDWSFTSELALHHHRGLATGTRLRCAIVVRSLGRTLRRAVTIRAVAAR